MNKTFLPLCDILHYDLQLRLIVSVRWEKKTYYVQIFQIKPARFQYKHS